jgi:hypothetical protein
METGAGMGFSPSAALARDHVGFIEEPEAAVLLQNLARGIEITACAQLLAQALVVDLRDVHGGVPGANSVEVPMLSAISEGSVCMS